MQIGFRNWFFLIPQKSFYQEEKQARLFLKILSSSNLFNKPQVLLLSSAASKMFGCMVIKKEPHGHGILFLINLKTMKPKNNET
jgi:hypothetical protein